MEELENVQWSTYELPNIPIYETKLPKDILDTLWGYIGKATDRLNHKLAGNIDESLILEDVEDTLLLFLTPVVERYLNTVRVKISDYDKISSELKLESLKNRDAELALSTARKDELINSLYNKMLNEVPNISGNKDLYSGLFRLITCVRTLERGGDHAVDICELASFLVTGEFKEF